MENGLLGDKSRNREEAIAIIQVRDDGGLDHSLKDDGKYFDLGCILKLMLKSLAGVGEGKCQVKGKQG